MPIPDADEYIIGSATIANLNDTDGDEIIDGDVKEIEITSHNGRGETNDKDLIRLSLRRPNGSLNNEEVKLSFPKGGSKIKLWKFRNKMEAAKLIYKCSELPIDVFVEALQPSESVRDIEIKMDYKTQSDIVSITAIWVEFKKSWHTRCPFNDPSCDQGTANPVAGANSGILSNMSGEINNTINSVRNSKDGSRFGHGYNGVIVVNGVNKDNNFGGRILFEFNVLPKLSESEYQDLGINFDCTRRKHVREFYSNHGDAPMLKFEEAFPFQYDSASDDNNNNINDEDNSPSDGLIYSWDAPGITNLISPNLFNDIAFKAQRLFFQEYVRVNIGEAVPGIGANGLIGSRSSTKVGWYTINYLKSGAGNILEPDNASVSYSYPKKSNNNVGTGSCLVELLNSPISDGYKLTFDNAKWKLTGSGAPIEASENPPGKWILTDGDKVKVTLTKGNTPFYPGDSFKFSVFKTKSQKQNEMGLIENPENNANF